MINDKKQIKSLILKITEKIGEASADLLVSSLLTADFADIATVTDSFEELIADGLIKMSGDACSLSDTGKMILPELESYLPATAVTAISSAVRHYNSASTGSEYTSEIKESDGSFYLTCRYTEKRTTVCEVILRFDEKSAAILAQKNYEKRPDSVIGTVKAVVTGDIGFMM